MHNLLVQPPLSREEIVALINDKNEEENSKRDSGEEIDTAKNTEQEIQQGSDIPFIGPQHFYHSFTGALATDLKNGSGILTIEIAVSIFMGKLNAEAYFEKFGFDSITVSPYMGKDSIEPFLSFKDRYAIILALTSNSGSEDFHLIHSGEKKVYERVIIESRKWNGREKMMYVVGATKAAHLADIRQIIPDSFLLIPGVGKQGGSLKEVSIYGMNSKIGILVNSSRSIIYASKKEDFAERAGYEASKLQSEMELILKKKNII